MSYLESLDEKARSFIQYLTEVSKECLELREELHQALYELDKATSVYEKQRLALHIRELLSRHDD